MNGGEQLGRHLSCLKSGATGEEVKEEYVANVIKS